MNERRDVHAWIADEAAVVEPPAGAADRGWERLSAALAAGVAPRADVMAPPGRVAWPWVVGIGLMIAAALAAWAVWPRPAPERVVLAAPPIEVLTEPAFAPAPLPVLVGPIAGSSPATSSAAPPAPVHPRVKRAPAAKPAVPEDSFAAELRIIAAAQRALRDGDPRAALRALADHARTFKAGQFVQDREALQAVALCKAGRAEGSRLAAAFLAAHPGSIHADRVRDACGR